MNLLGENKHTLSVIKDPFSKNNIHSVTMFMRINWSNNPEWSGHIEFMNGNTKGRQATGSCKDFDELMIKMKEILNSVT